MPRTTSMHIKRGDEPARGFEYDRCFWSFSEDHPLYATQQTLHDEVGCQMIENAVAGFNNCIFAYGQTGSGKSYSVLGGQGEQRGLLPRVVEGLFERFTQLEEGVTVKAVVSFVEIYNEKLRDLLASDETVDSKVKLAVREHPILGIIVPGLTQSVVENCTEVLDLVDYGTSNRRTSATAMNATSSRSHCIFSFKTNLISGDQVKLSQTHLVDLAGSERQKRTQAAGDRLKEGAAINQSLSTLARVISALADSSKKKAANPPFRTSKLTHILKESLCGNSKTVMMAAISPSLADYEETLSTLNFAKSVKQVQTAATANVLSTATLEQALREEVEALKAKVQMAQEQRHDPDQDARLKDMQEKIDKQARYMARMGLTSDKDYEAARSEDTAMAERRRTMVMSGGLPGKALHDDSDDGSWEEWDGQDSESDPDSPDQTRSSSRRSARKSSKTSARSDADAESHPATVLARRAQGSGGEAGCVLQLLGRDSHDSGAQLDAEAVTQKLQQLQELADQVIGVVPEQVDLRPLVVVDAREPARVDVVVRVLAPAAGQAPRLGEEEECARRKTTVVGSRERWLSSEEFQREASSIVAAAEQGGSSGSACTARALVAGGRGGPEAEGLRRELDGVRRELCQVRCRAQAAKAELGLLSAAAGAPAAPGALGLHPAASEVAKGFQEALAALDHARDLVRGVREDGEAIGQRGLWRGHRRRTLEALWNG
ncbi:unnamed protein product [Prorocentrum cordatum]|nr:unnamed protein product [Polarella glacialis]